MNRVAIMGATGYTGAELVRILSGHPGVELVCLTSQQYVGKRFSEVFPAFRGRVDLELESGEVELVAPKADLFFTALPHQAAMEPVAELLGMGKRVIDLSADFRLVDPDVYEQWYQPHLHPELLPEAVYGLPELNSARIAEARLVANPGCYPTSAVLALAPLLLRRLIDPTTIVVDSKSGTSGAGRGLKTGSLFCEVNEGFQAYGVGGHRHTPEIEQLLGELAGEPVRVSFTPHLLPVNRGILSTCYARLDGVRESGELVDLFQDFYARAPFVRVFPKGRLPNIAWTRGSNYCDLGVVDDQRTGRVVVVSTIDNLVKGAAGQAVQNLNLMLGLEEATGLASLAPLFP